MNSISCVDHCAGSSHFRRRLRFTPAFQCILIALALCTRMNAQTQTAGADSLNSSSSITLRSMPAGAEVYFDSILVGLPPIDSFPAAAGTHTVTFRMAEFIPKTVQVRLKAGKSVRYSTVLLPSFGFFSVAVSPAEARIEIDSSTTIVGGIVKGKIAEGWHTISVSHPAHENTLADNVYISPGMFYEFNAPIDRFSARAALASALIPGLGQFDDGARLKGSLEFLAAAGAAYFLTASLKGRSKADNDLQKDISTYVNAANEDAAIAAHAAVARSVSRLKTARDRALASKIGMGIVYALSVIDALVFHTSQRELLLDDSIMLDSPALNEFGAASTIQIGIKARIR